MLSVALALKGHELREAPDGGSAIAAARETLPDVAIVDIGLPDMDGYEVARRLRALAASRTVALIALTGYGQEEDQARARDAGFDAHLVKPLDVESLLEVLSALAANRPATG